jgi:hypothetical protein
MPRPLDVRVVGRARAHPTSAAERERWRALMPSAGALAREVRALAAGSAA